MVEIKRLRDTAKIPTYGSNDSACADLYSCVTVTIQPNTTEKIPTGWAMKPPSGYMLQILQRSGLASKSVFAVGGVIDWDYRGEICVLLHNSSNEPYTVKLYDRIAQIALRRFEQAYFQEVPELDDTERGQGGFGSTGL